MLAPSKEKILHTAFLLYMAMSKKHCHFEQPENAQVKESMADICEKPEHSKVLERKSPKVLTRNLSQSMTFRSSTTSLFKKDIKKVTKITEVDIFNLVSSSAFTFLN